MFIDENAEIRLLAAIVDNPALSQKYRAELFTRERQNIFKAMHQCYLRYGDISSEGVELYLGSELPVDIELARGARAEPLEEKLVYLARKRQLIEVSNSIQHLLTGNNNLNDSTLRNALTLDTLFTNEDSGISPGVSEFISRFQKKRLGNYTFIDTGLFFLNDMMGGEWARQGLTIVMGQPGAGKTALILNSIFKMAELGLPSLFFSLEMRKHALVSRMIASLTGIDNTKIKTGKVTEEEAEKIENALQLVQTLPFYVLDSPHTTVNDMVYEIKRHKDAYGIHAVFIDYLQVVPIDNIDRDNESIKLGSIASKLRNAAVDNDIACILLSQQSGEDTIFGSNRVKHHADVVFKLELDDSSYSADQVPVVFDFVKNRDGRKGSITSFYKPKTLKFE